jgi:hypothetical protein
MSFGKTEIVAIVETALDDLFENLTAKAERKGGDIDEIPRVLDDWDLGDSYRDWYEQGE